jgi:iron complex transport system ATP-binding protein
MSAESVVELRDVELERGGNKILRGISLLIERGQHWAVIGPNGSGKTALISVITAYLWPSRGSAWVLGQRLGSVNVHDLRKRIGLVSSSLFERVPGGESVLEVIASGRFASLGLYDRPTAKDIKAARELGKKFGLGNLLGREYRVLSFGERQRTLIARALIASPELLILDEPCEGLDIAARELLLDAVDGITSDPQGPTVIIITHRIEEIGGGISHALLLSGGRITAAGHKAKTLAAGNISAAFGIAVEITNNNGRYFAFPCSIK